MGAVKQTIENIEENLLQTDYQNYYNIGEKWLKILRHLRTWHIHGNIYTYVGVGKRSPKWSPAMMQSARTFIISHACGGAHTFTNGDDLEKGMVWTPFKHSLNLQSSVTILLWIGLCKWQSYLCISNWFGLAEVGHGYSFSILGQVWTSPRLYLYVVITCVYGRGWGGALV